MKEYFQIHICGGTMLNFLFWHFDLYCDIEFKDDYEKKIKYFS
jgi:hypothetical protein